MLLRCECQAVYIHSDNLPQTCRYCARKLGVSLSPHGKVTTNTAQPSHAVAITIPTVTKKAKTCAACRTEIGSKKVVDVHNSRKCEAKAIKDVLDGRLPFRMVCSHCSEGFTNFEEHYLEKHSAIDEWEVYARYMCQFCPKAFDEARGLAQHTLSTHAVCPACGEYFSSARERDEHQRMTGHHYCDEHDVFFLHKGDFEAHKRFKHTEYGCVDCDMAFNSQRALEAHLESSDHEVAALAATLRADATREIVIGQNITALEDINLWCERCDRGFADLPSLQKHRESAKHNPLSELACPLSNTCKRVFLSPSALLNHLESGSCKSGIDLLKLNALVHAHDVDRHITKEENVVEATARASNVIDAASEELSLGQAPRTDYDETGSVMSVEDGVRGLTPSSLSRKSSFGGVILTPPTTISRSSSFGGGVLLTPMSSSIGLSGGSESGGVLLTPEERSTAGSSSALVQSGAARGVWPCMVPSCRKIFSSKASLLMHLSSLAHAPKLYYCPVGIDIPAFGARRAFRSLSGLAAHIEAGACTGGKETLRKICGMFEARIAGIAGIDAKLLLDEPAPLES